MRASRAGRPGGRAEPSSPSARAQAGREDAATRSADVVLEKEEDIKFVAVRGAGEGGGHKVRPCERRSRDANADPHCLPLHPCCCCQPPPLTS
jgi:hypothetical protein